MDIESKIVDEYTVKVNKIKGNEGGGVGCDVAVVPRAVEDVMAVVDLWCGDARGGCVEMRWCGRGYDEMFDLAVHDFDWFFDEMKLVVELTFISGNG
nr:hypothetical protein [Tanacetum cinerariifolium]